MDIFSKRQPVNGTRVGIGFKSKNQLPLVMIWREFWRDGEVVHAHVIFSSLDLFGHKFRS